MTGTEDLGAEIAGEGVLVKGNLRAPRQEVFEKVQAGCERLFPNKYTVFVLEEPGGIFDDDSSPGASMSGSFDSSDPSANTRGPRVSFLIVPADKAGPNPATSGWQYVVAMVLFGLTAGSAFQLGLVAEVSRLPAATMDWLAAGSQGIDTTLAPGELPPGLEDFDVQAYVEGAFPIAGGIWAVSAAHEVGHMIAAAVREVKIGIPFLIPNGQLGTFGSITQIKSLPKTREDIFDVAIAGPIAGTVVASTLFFYGLALSAGATRASCCRSRRSSSADRCCSGPSRRFSSETRATRRRGDGAPAVHRGMVRNPRLSFRACFFLHPAFSGSRLLVS